MIAEAVKNFSKLDNKYCTVCKKGILKSRYQQHSEQFHVHCDICNNDVRKSHYKKHANQFHIYCAFCNKTIIKYQHFKQHLNEYRIRCSVCHVDMKKSDYMKHAKEFHTHCKLCNVDVIKGGFQHHLQHTHQSYHCTICNIFLKISEYNRHSEQFHVYCELCNRDLLKSDYMKHAKEFHTHCKLCNVDVIKGGFQHHLQHTHQSYHSTICNIFLKISEYNRHSEQFHVYCELCNRDLLKSRYQQHSEQFHINCDICNVDYNVFRYTEHKSQFHTHCKLCNVDISKSKYTQHSEQFHTYCKLCNVDVKNSDYQQHLKIHIQSDKYNKNLPKQIHSDNIINKKLIIYQDDNGINQKDDLTNIKKMIKSSDLTILPEERKRTHLSLEVVLRNVKFRKNVLTAYKFTCAICRLQMNLIEAAHIISVKDGGTDEVINGIALCHNHHSAFDSHLIIIREDYKITLNDEKVNQLKNLKRDSGLNELESLINKTLLLPKEKRYYPNQAYLKKRIHIMNSLGIISEDKINLPIKTINSDYSKVKDNHSKNKYNSNSTQELPHFKADLFPKKKTQEYSKRLGIIQIICELYFSKPYLHA